MKQNLIVAAITIYLVVMCYVKLVMYFTIAALMVFNLVCITIILVSKYKLRRK